MLQVAMNFTSKFTEEGDAAVAFPVIRGWLVILSTPEVPLLAICMPLPIFMQHADWL